LQTFKLHVLKETIQHQSTDFLGGQLFSVRSVIMFVVGVLFVVFGFILMKYAETMSAQALVVSPIVLLVGYLILIPTAILYKEK